MPVGYVHDQMILPLGDSAYRGDLSRREIRGALRLLS